MNHQKYSEQLKVSKIKLFHCKSQQNSFNYILSEDMKYMNMKELEFKKGSCQFLAKECAQYWLTA